MNEENQDFDKIILEMPSERLCEIIISHRYLGLFEKESIKAMEELSRRRSCGDQFEFELYIENNLNKLPKYSLNLKNMFLNSKLQWLKK